MDLIQLELISIYANDFDSARQGKHLTNYLMFIKALVLSELLLLAQSTLCRYDVLNYLHKIVWKIIYFV